MERGGDEEAVHKPVCGWGGRGGWGDEEEVVVMERRVGDEEEVVVMERRVW